MKINLPFRIPEPLRQTARKHQVLTVILGFLGTAILLLGQGFILLCAWNWVFANHIVGVTHLNIWEGAIAILAWKICFRSHAVIKPTKQTPPATGKMKIEEVTPKIQ